MNYSPEHFSADIQSLLSFTVFIRLNGLNKVIKKEVLHEQGTFIAG
jgi:hypothetical protein